MSETSFAPKSVHNDTLYLAQLIESLRMAELYRTAVYDSHNAGWQSRKAFDRIGTHIRCAVRELTDRMSPETLAIVRAEILDDEVVMTLNNIKNMLLAVSRTKREEIECHIETEYHAYQAELQEHKKSLAQD